jgi:chromosome segregation and condensation protein ScpB
MASPRKNRTEFFVNINSRVGRNINRSTVLNAIRVQQPISRAEISKMTRLSKSTISSIVGSLIAEDLVVEDPDSNQEVGRNPINLQIKRGKHFIGAISIDSENTELAVADIDGTIKRSARASVQGS